MVKMPIITTDSDIQKYALEICSKFMNYFTPVLISSREEALEYLKYELPEISVINFSDAKIDARKVLDDIKADPWLHYGGIIGIHFHRDEKRVEELMVDSNILSLIPRRQFIMNFYRVLRILAQNRQILFQRGLQTSLIGTLNGSLIMENDPFNARTYANLVSNFLYNANYIDMDTREKLLVALFEMLMNAIEHGNCEISYEEKNNWLHTHGDILELIRTKNEDQQISAKKVYITYKISPEKSTFTIRDEGNGFDWRSRLEADSDDVNLDLHGHGIRMTNHYMCSLRYNDKGNRVSFDMDHAATEVNAVPGIFANREEVAFKDQDIVFTEGEESNFLYYIVSGKLDIYSKSKLISSLTTDDIFLGEMSFLLNDKRSATVMANGNANLIKISKNDFVNAIKENPHYGIFLARLIAQRLSKLNAHFARLKSL